jgi:hypothetical protein
MHGVSRRNFVQRSALVTAATKLGAESAANAAVDPARREYWVSVLTRIAEPVLSSTARQELKSSMPVETSHGNAEERRQYTYLEALGRLLAGISAWLETNVSDPAEAQLKERYSNLARQAIAAAVDPASHDYMNFSKGTQPLVDAAFLALAVLRAPRELLQKLDSKTRTRLVDALRSSRVILPSFNNWLMFSATVEAFLCQAGESWDRMRVDYAVRQHEEWYKGDGIYGEGPQFHWDYYNSYVIQPMLIEVLDTVSPHANTWDSFRPAILQRARRYAAIQERFIGPDGAFPPIGRSLTYRFGAFHLLAAVALRGQLPERVSPGQVRGALSAVIHRMIEMPGTFDAKGWLTVGFSGHQPSLGEAYISTGSLYLCSTGLLPLGLPPSDLFWSAPVEDWTSRRIWNGKDVAADHAL